jgi:MoaA/NifB/PqqE/SkfB family radical SAM enzyme
MAMETYLRLAPAFRRTRLVYLQGWGEPLLHPGFFDMVDVAKRAGCRVGVTTNGMHLDEATVRRIIATQVDLVAVSLAGTGERNDRIRSGTRLERVLETVRLVERLKKIARSDRPAVHVAYLLVRSALDEIKSLPARLEGLPIDQVVISTLDYMPDREWEREAIRPESEDDRRGVKTVLDEVVDEGSRRGMEIHYRLASPGGGGGTCVENVQRALFVSADGDVSPCVYTNVPVREATRICRGREEPCPKVVFGNVCDMPIASVWRSEAYVHFRRAMQSGCVVPSCEGCPKRSFPE